MIADIAAAGPYNAFYLLAFALAAALAWRHGVRRGWDPAAWAALIALAAAGGVAGSKLFFFSLTLGAPGQKTFLGGVLGGALAFLAFRRPLGLGRDAGDAFAVPLPVAAAVGRVGCFLAGCCFGTPTRSPWGVRYAAGSEAFDAQAAAGLVAPGAAASLPVHPVQLYEAALDLLLAATVARHRHRLRRPESAVLLSFAGLAIIRFGAEFLRFEGGAPVLLGLRTVQWTVLAAALALAVLVAWRERAGVHSSGSRAGDAPAWRPAAILAALLAAAAWSGTRWLTALEALTVVATLGIALAVTVRGVWPALPVRPALQPAGVTAAASLLLLQAGTSPDSMRRDTLPALSVRLDSIAGSPFFPRAYVTVGASGMRGAYVESCGDAHRYQATGVSLRYTVENSEDERRFVQLLGFVGRDRSNFTLSNEPGQPERLFEERADLGGGGAGFGWDRRRFGIGAGVFGGTLGADGEVRRGFMPFGYLRVGPESKFFVDLRLGMPEPVGYPGPIIQLGGGHRFVSGSTLRGGFSGSGPFLSGTVLLPGGFEIEPLGAYGDTGTFHAAIALRKRFGVR